MTKEELEKEADDYVANTDTSICEFEGIVAIICDGEGNAIDADSIAKSAYLAGAEPREKRIEQLEKEIKRLETELAITDNDREHNYYECLDLYKKVEELNNELAELRVKNETLEKEAELYKPRWHNIKKDGQPPKAGLYLCYRRWHYTDMHELIYWTGEYWVTGSTDYDVIFAWCEIPKFEEE